MIVLICLHRLSYPPNSPSSASLSRIQSYSSIRRQRVSAAQKIACKRRGVEHFRGSFPEYLRDPHVAGGHPTVAEHGRNIDNTSERPAETRFKRLDGMDSAHPHSHRRTASPTPELQRSTHCILADETLSVVRTHRLGGLQGANRGDLVRKLQRVLEQENHRAASGSRRLTSARRHYSESPHEPSSILSPYPGFSSCIVLSITRLIVVGTILICHVFRRCRRWCGSRRRCRFWSWCRCGRWCRRRCRCRCR